MRQYQLFKHRVKQASLRWGLDDEGGLTFSLFNMFHFTKYKDDTLFRIGRRRFRRAPRWIYWGDER